MRALHLIRMRSGHQFITQDQSVFRGPRLGQCGAKDVANVGQVARERRQICGDRLLIADVRHDLVEESDAAASFDRDEQSRARAERSESRRLEQDGFAARIRARHDQDVRVFGG